MDTTSTSHRRHPFLRAAILGVAAGALFTIGAAAASDDAPREPAATASWTGDAKDHPGFGPVNPAASTATGDESRGPAAPAGWTGDAKDHPGFGPVNPAASTAAGDVEAFCQAALAAEEAAFASEDPAAIQPTLDNLATAVPSPIKEAVGTWIESLLAGEESPESDAAHGELIGYVKDKCGFATLTVIASEYAFDGLPGTLDAGPVVADFDNRGTEFHVLWVVRINDGVTLTLDELLAMPRNESANKVTEVGGVFAAPGETGYGMLDLQPGRYVAICLLPTGATPENMPLIQSGEHDGDPHFTHGMIQEFDVT